MNSNIIQIISIITTLMGGIGIGSLLTTFLKDRFERRQHKFKEKLAVYAGYIEALQNSIIVTNEETKQKVVYWHLRIRLLAPKKIDELAHKFYRQDVTKNFHLYRDEIIDEMKKDLESSF